MGLEMNAIILGTAPCMDAKGKMKNITLQNTNLCLGWTRPVSYQYLHVFSLLRFYHTIAEAQD